MDNCRANTPFQQIEKELRVHKIHLKRPQDSGAATASQPHTTYQGTADSGPVTVHAYDIASLPHASWGTQLLNYCGLVHPHIVRLQKLLRTPGHVCVLTEAVCGGNIFSLTRRAGAAGLPAPAARFLLQQVLATAKFLQRYGIHVADVNPSGFLVHWNDRGMPILKLAVLSLHSKLERAEKAGRRGAQVVATMLTCPHLVRQETVHADSAGYAAARDAWAVTVVLYFLLYGRWPFSQAQMQRWAAGGKWEDHALIDYNGVNGGPPPAPDVVPLLRGVFACGALPAKDFTRKCHAMFSVEKMLQHAWVAEDCPAGAVEMAAEYFAKTEARRASPEFCDLRNSVTAALETRSAPKTPTPPPVQQMLAAGAVRV